MVPLDAEQIPVPEHAHFTLNGCNAINVHGLYRCHLDYCQEEPVELPSMADQDVD